MLTIETPEGVGLNPVRWHAALTQVEEWCQQDLLPAAGLLFARGGKTTGVQTFGRQKVTRDSPPVRDDAVFLIASITKPLVAMAALRLVEQGLLSLADRVTEFIPEFGHGGKYGVTIRNLLTHTSGLPDMLSNNVELRQNQAPLSAFVAGTCEVSLDFPPGRGVQYQSMGFAILGDIIERLTGMPCAEYLRTELFEPLGMNDTALGAPDSWFAGETPFVDRISELRVPPEAESGLTWNWNSRYWRSLGAPWGGLLTTPADLAKVAQLMLNGGSSDNCDFLSPAAVRAATSNQLDAMRDVPAEDRRCRPWGLGWRLHWPAHTANFGDFLGPRTYGHWGATGTVLWIDPDADAFFLAFTTQPQEPHGKYLARLSNMVAAAMR